MRSPSSGSPTRPPCSRSGRRSCSRRSWRRSSACGPSGGDSAPKVGIITPSQVGVRLSLEVVVWVAFGGRGTLWGALVGAISVHWLRSVLTVTYPRLWPIILGGLFMAVILLFPAGLIGLAVRAKALVARRGRAVAPAAV